MLREVAVKGFRCFDALKWHSLPLTQETVIMGPNNSGKSALLSVIDFFRASYWQFPSVNLQEKSSIHNWGRFPDYLHPTLINRLSSKGATPEMFLRLAVLEPAGCSIEIKRTGAWSRQVKWVTEKNESALRKAIQSIWHLAPIRPEFPTSQSVGTGSVEYQPLRPNGGNAIQFLLERFTARDPDWDEAEKWLRLIDPHMDSLIVPLRGQTASIETERTYGEDLSADVNIAYQGTGIQSVCSVVAALVFSEPGTTVIIEEPEAYLHPRSQEVIVDLMNTAANEWDKQVIVTTHSWSIILPFISDVGTGRPRGKKHPKADPKKFSLIMMDDDHNIIEYDLKGKPYRKVRDDAKKLWG